MKAEKKKRKAPWMVCMKNGCVTELSVIYKDGTVTRRCKRCRALH